LALAFSSIFISSNAICLDFSKFFACVQKEQLLFE